MVGGRPLPVNIFVVLPSPLAEDKNLLYCVIVVSTLFRMLTLLENTL